VLSGTTANPAQVAEGARVNTESRQRALKIGLLIIPGLSLLNHSGRTSSRLSAGRIAGSIDAEEKLTAAEDSEASR